MSVSLTEQAVVERRKTVTRRLGWRFLKPGDRLTLCRKVMGRRRADGAVEPLVRLADVVVVSVRRERLWDITDDDIAREGVDDPELFEDVYVETGLPTTSAWVQWFCEQMDCRPDDEVTRIEWRYLDAGRSICPVCARSWTVTPLDDCLMPACGCYGHDASHRNPARPCHTCGLAHALGCEVPRAS